MTIRFDNDVEQMITNNLSGYSRNGKVSFFQNASGWFTIKIGNRTYEKVEMMCEVQSSLSDLQKRGFNVESAMAKAIK